MIAACCWPLAAFMSLLIGAGGELMGADLGEQNSSDATDAVDVLLKLFDFSHYQRVFGKTYESPGEEQARRSYYLANALKALVSGFEYKYRLESYFLSVNHMSDWSPNELSQMMNKVMALKEGAGSVKSDEDDHDDHQAAIVRDSNDAEFAHKLGQLLDEHANESPYKELLEFISDGGHGQDNAPRHRNKRDTGSSRKRPLPRQFSFDELIESEENDSNGSTTVDGSRSRKNYKLWTRSAVDDLPAGLKNVRLYSVLEDDTDRLVVQTVSAMKKVVEGQKTRFYYPDDAEYDQIKLPDEVFVDHSRSGCMFKPRKQGKCGSCYAFGAISIAEWLHCKQTGKLVAFSEQYMVDCGRDRINHMSGCKGSPDFEAIAFLRNFGVELAQRYPYTAKEQPCPYEAGVDLKETGYIRLGFKGFVAVPLELWDKYIETAPFYVGFAAYGDFRAYGGGVHDGSYCQGAPNHAMVLVGHGRMDGQEYWLLRNSYGTGWGEKGYMLLAKTATQKCFPEQRGIIISSKDGKRLRAKPYENPRHKRIKIEHSRAAGT
jgi:hypothetical protein